MPDSRSAAHPATDGVAIERRFTEPGKHPFDQVEWEIRDALIGDPVKPAFEQRGVEFPKSWSQNATNIVAQKYFRGRLGSDERESSVKQMIGRVAGTIASWGREGGYFASGEDAQAFEDELTHILLHQMAAFNSPVWFNVGFEEQPQCSACFILSVDDTMESILAWNTKEGMIFRGGSGSGINLSNIRSSKEHLSKGGLASGPVSFMRGADAWAGTIKSGGKCFREGTLVATPTGMQPIERLHIGDQVLTHRGPRAVADFMPNGRKQCYRVRTREGYEVEVTAGHKFAYWNDGEGGFDVKRIETFVPGDALYAPLVACEGGAQIPLLAPEIADPANATTTVEMELPTVLDERLAYVLGLTYGDGDIRTEHPYRLQVAFCKDEAGRESANRFSDYCRDLFGEEPLLLGDCDRHQDLGYTRKRLVEFLVANGLAKGQGDSLGFPEVLFRAEPEVRAAFVAGVIDADGSYQRRGGWAISSIDRTFLVNLQRLLISIGVPSKIKLNRERRGNWRPLHKLHVVGHTFIERLVDQVEPHSAKAQVTYVPSPGADKGWGYRPSVFGSLTARVQTRGGYRLVERSVGMNETSGYRALARLTEHPDTAVAEYAEELSSCVQLTLESVTPTEIAETYDIEVEDVHQLCANGIYASNTRRAAKMIVLDVDHPDILDFIWCKAREEEKAAALRDAGFDMRLDSESFASIQYQNANNSVRVSDEFMERAERGEQWELTARVDGHVIETVGAADLLRQISDAAWRCADPGVQYDTTINDWHTCPNSGRINASNPCCFVGETLILTADGPIRFDELHERFEAGEELPYTWSFAVGAPAMARISRVWVAGATDRLIEVATDEGETLLCTPEHRFLLEDGRYVEAQALTVGAHLRAVTPAPVPVGALGRTDEAPSGDPLAGEQRVAEVREVELEQPARVFDMEVPGFGNFVVTSSDGLPGRGVVVHNSEYMHVDDSACNLASLNLLKFRRPDGTFDVDAFEHAVDVMILAQEIIVSPSSYPTEEIGKNARAFRQLGLGYSNLGAYLMASGLPYNSDEGRATCGAITALMTGRAYRKSAEVAAAMGPYERYAENAEPHLHVMRKHQAAAYEIEDSLCRDKELLAAARRSWDEAVALGERHGYRNAQASVIAPTGTISFLLDCDTTGIEPDFSLVKFKELVGGGQMTIVNRTVPLALRELGYSDQEIEQIEAYLAEHGTIIGAPGLKEEHLPVFDVAVGERAISHMGHIKMMAAAQPFISGAISKTVNLPSSATVEDVADAYIQGWKLGLKALAIYRDGSKTAQALRTEDKEKKAEPEAVPAAEPAEPRPMRRRMPRERMSITHKFSIAGHEGYITAGMYEDGSVGEIFLTDIGKEGSTLRGMMNAFATSISIALQYGVPLETLVRKFSYMRFDPEGVTTNPEIPFAKSMPDYIMRWLCSRFCDVDLQEELGILTPEVRARKAAQEALLRGDTAASEAAGDEPRATNGGDRGATASADPRPASSALTDEPPVTPAKLEGLDLGPACGQCGGMMQRTGSCYTCSSCGNNTGCG
jgi:ribonucleotide reductase alpha subunit